MFAKHQKKILFTTLALGYFGYRKALQHVIFSNQNVFLSQESINDLKTNNYVYVGPNRVLIGSPLNNDYGSKKNRVIIIGGGLIGASTAYELSKNPENEVILLEKREDVGLETSYENGSFLAPSTCYPWISASFLNKVFKSFLNSESPVTFSYKTFFEKYFGTWVLNMLTSFMTSSVEESCRKLVYIGNKSMNEFQNLRKVKPDFDTLESTAKGTLCLYPSQESFDKTQNVREIKQKMGITFKTLGEQETKNKEQFLKDVSDFKLSTFTENDSNCNSLELTKLLTILADRNGAKVCLETEFQRFLVERSVNKVIGVVTNNGTVLCDKVIVAAGYSSKNIIDLLGIRLPLLPVQGYSFTTDNTKKTQLNHLISEDSGLVHIAPLKNKIRISGIADIGCVNEFDQNRLELLVNSAQKYTGTIDITSGKSWIGVRPLTPDDVPIIGPVPGYPDIILNTGHSSKGLTLSLGSAITVRSMLEGRDKDKLEEDYSIKRFYLI